MSLTAFYAAETPLAVLLHQRDAALWQMILWDRDAGRFEMGDAVRGTVFPERCAIAPDGVHFLYFMEDGQPDRASKGSFTAICRPPLFKPLALYPQGDLFGGGYFVDAQTYVIQSGTMTEDIVGAAAGLTRANRAQGAAMTPRAARGFARRVKVKTPDAPPYVIEGSVLRHVGGTVIKDFAEAV